MLVTNVTVSAGRTFNHPMESYSNLRCDVRMNADLSEVDDVEASIKELQAKAEMLVEDHKQKMLVQIEELERRRQFAQRKISLEQQIERNQRELDELREEEAPRLMAAEA